MSKQLSLQNIAIVLEVEEKAWLTYYLLGIPLQTKLNLSFPIVGPTWKQRIDNEEF